MYPCTPTFTAALFTIARTQKQTRYPLTDEWIKKLWYIYTMEYDSAMKRNDLASVLVRCMCACQVASVMSDSCDPWTVAHHASLSIGFSRQEYWSELPCLPPGDHPKPGG